jgi:hypothetical protein
MRLPGTHNTKGGAWTEVRLVESRPSLRYELGELEDWLTGNTPIIRRKGGEKGNGASNGNGLFEAQDNPWEALGEHFKAPIDVETRLAAMRYQGPDDSGIHATQLAVSASLLSQGHPLDEVVQRLFDATCEAAGAAGASWNWTREKNDIRGLCESWIAKLKQEQSTEKDDDTQDNNNATTHSGGIWTDIKAWNRGPTTIPPRPFVYSKHYMRGAIGSTIAAGGRGKTTLSVYEAVSMAAGRDLKTGNCLPSGPLRVLLLNGEEDQDELDRRIAATLAHYNVSQAELGARLFARSVRNQPIRIATLERNATARVDTKIIDAMTKFIIDNAIDVFMVDPLVSFHSVLENDNTHMDTVVKFAFGAVAIRGDCAGELFHHPGKPKPGQAETTVEDGRGASAIIWAVRSARVMNFMTPEEAGRLGISEKDRRLYIRLANGKANAAPLGSAEWIKLEVETLSNRDEVAVSGGSWTPPDPFANVATADMHWTRETVRNGNYRRDPRSHDWVGRALAQRLKLDPDTKGDREKLIAILKTWFAKGVLAIEIRKDTKRRDKEFVVPGNWNEDHAGSPEEDD